MQRITARRWLTLLVSAGGLMVMTSCASVLGWNRQDITVESFPSGAHVVVAGRHRGVTPLTVTLPTNQTPVPAITLVRKDYWAENISLERAVSPLVYLNLVNPFGYGLDWVTGAMFNLKPTHIEAGLTKRNGDTHRKGQEEGPAPTEVVVAASPQSWWVHSYAKTCEGCQVARMQEDTLGVVDAHGVEEALPLEDIYLISSGAQEKPGALLRMSLWKMLGAGVGALALGATGFAVGTLAFPRFRTGEEDTSALITFTTVFAGLGAGLGDVKGFFMQPDDEAPPDFQALMADWSVEQKRGWIKNNVLR